MTTLSYSPTYPLVREHDDTSNNSITTSSSVNVLTDDIDKKQNSEKKYGVTDVSTTELVLPPCRICAEKASGFHYGVNTCEACKAFFRRSLRQGTMYVCAANGACDILPGKRNSCAACRLKKCLNNGMSKSAIKTGRYTHTMRARHLMEVRGLKESDAISVATVACKDTPPAETDAVSVNVAVHDDKQSARTDTVATVSNETPAPSQKSASLDGIKRRRVSPVPEFQEIEQVIQHMTSVKLQQFIWTPEFTTEKNRHEKIYLEQRALHQEIFGPMRAIGVEEYMTLYQMTGIDIDGRRDLLQTTLLPFWEVVIKRYIMFAKTIPGFVQLPINGQIALIKATRFESFMIICQSAFNPIEKLYINDDGRVMSIEELNAFGGGMNEDIFEVQRRLQSLHLTEEEKCTLAALSIMSTDNCDEVDAEMVARSHSLLLNCFLHLVETNHSDDPLFMARVVSVLVDLRSLREAYGRHEEQFALQWSRVVEMPQILNEMLSVP